MSGLFRARDGSWAGGEQLGAALRAVGAHDCDILYMHAGLSFGAPAPGMGRTRLLDAIYQAVRSLGTRTLCVPTFTFSFCNGEDFDRERSASRMGALTEHVRRQPGAVRSVDPLMSVALVGEDRDLAEGLGHASIGADSTFDRLSRKSGVRFLFLGVHPGDCFTYMHYLEWRARVPFRYDREFRGRISAGGRTWTDAYTLFVRYHNVHPGDGSYRYAETLLQQEHMKRAAWGDGPLYCVEEPVARRVYLDTLQRDPNYFLREPFTPGRADARFEAHDMVAL